MVNGASIFLMIAVVAAFLGSTMVAGIFVFMCLMLLVAALFATRAA